LSVDEPGMLGFTVTELDVKLALVCRGRPLTLKLTVLLEEPRSDNIIVSVPLPPRLIVNVDAAEMLKSDAGTISVKVAVWVFVPSVPVIVAVVVPASAPLATVTFSGVLVDPFCGGVTEAALQVIAPLQAELNVKLTLE
jgi:hypothetical protein